VIASEINTGAGADRVTFQSGSVVQDTTITTGSGNDLVEFLGTSSVVGGGASLGSGPDTLIFGANSFVEAYNIDLGAGVDVDRVSFLGGLTEEQGVTITNATAGDILVIGANIPENTYTYDSVSGDFANSTDTISWLT
jgi:hypothetical protein